MKRKKNERLGLTLTAALLLCCLCLYALAEEGAPFLWRTYTLNVALVSTDPAIVSVKDAPTDGPVVLVKLVPTAGTMRTEDIKNYCEEIALRDKDGAEYKPAMWRVRGVDFDTVKGLFSTKPEQDALELLYYLKGKTADALVGAKLLVPTGAEGEITTVELDKAPRTVSADETPKPE